MYRYILKVKRRLCKVCVLRHIVHFLQTCVYGYPRCVVSFLQKRETRLPQCRSLRKIVKLRTKLLRVCTYIRQLAVSESV